MGLFNKRDDQQMQYIRMPEPTLEEASEQAKQQAIDYICTLDKNEYQHFLDGVDQVWQGYNNHLDKVATRHQKALRRNAKQVSDDPDDELLNDILKEA